MRALGLVTTEPSAAQLMKLQDSIADPDRFYCHPPRLLGLRPSGKPHETPSATKLLKESQLLIRAEIGLWPSVFTDLMKAIADQGMADALGPA